MSTRPDARQVAAVFAGGMAGTLTRAAADQLLPADPGAWPWATLAVNLAGALILGLAAVVLARRAYARSLVGTGFCGALTTFSTFSIEAFQMADRGSAGMAATYVVISTALGLAAAGGGIVLGRRLAIR